MSKFITIGGENIQTENEVRYLSVFIENNLSFVAIYFIFI